MLTMKRLFYLNTLASILFLQQLLCLSGGGEGGKNQFKNCKLNISKQSSEIKN